MTYEEWATRTIPMNEGEVLLTKCAWKVGAASRDAEVEGYARVLLQVRKAICGDINNTDDIIELVEGLKSQLADALAKVRKP